jgi:hypothetical protein
MYYKHALSDLTPHTSHIRGRLLRVHLAAALLNEGY